MGLLRIIVPLLAVWLLYRWLRRGKSGPPARAGQGEAAPEAMRRCSHCGVYVPESAALAAGGRYYCSRAHRLDAGEGGE